MKYFSLLSILSACLFGGISSANAQAGLSQTFSPSTIGPGSVSTLTFTINNQSSSVAVGDVSFTSVLPAGVTIATPANALIDGGDGTLSAPDGGSTITFSSGTVSAYGTCTIFVDVTGSTPGTYINPAVTLSSSSGSSMSSSVNLVVSASLPGFSQSFSPSSGNYGDRFTLTFIIDNTLNASAIGAVSFSEQLPTGLVIADPANAFTDCISAGYPNTTVTAVPGTDVISLSAAGSSFVSGWESLPAGVSRTVTVDVVAESSGQLDSTSEELLADYVSVGRSSASLDIAAASELMLRETFVDDPVAPGATTAALEFTIMNRSRSAAATDISFTNDLDAVLSGLVATGSSLFDVCGSGSTLSVGSSVVLTGGNLEAGESCTFSVPLLIPVNAASGSYPGTSSPITGTLDGSPFAGSPAGDTLFVSEAPVLTMEFLNDLVAPGDTVTIEYTLTNTSISNNATDITFTDELTEGESLAGFLPFPLSVGTLPSSPCGAGSTLTLVFLDIDSQGLLLNGGSLAAGASATFQVTLTVPQDMPGGQYVSSTEAVSCSINGETETGNTASDTINIVSTPKLSKEFTDDPVSPGDTVTLEYTLSLPEEASAPASGITFTDDLDACLSGLVATGLPLYDPCGVGSSLSGTRVLTLSGGSLFPGDSYTFSVTLRVPSGATLGTFDSTTSDMSANVAGLSATSPAASDDLTVTGLIFTKEFLDDPLIAGETGTLRFVIQNIHPTDDVTGIAFSDSLTSALSGLSVAGSVTQDTVGGSLNGTTTIIYSGGSVASGQSGIIDVPVQVPPGAADGSYRNVTGTLSATQGSASVTAGPAADTLVVNSSRLELAMDFTDDPAGPGDPVTLELTLTNLDATRTITSAAFTVDLDSVVAGMTFDSVVSNTLSGTVSGTGSSVISVSNVSIAASASAMLQVSLTVPAGTADGTYSFSSSTLTGELSGLAVTGSAASGDLDVVQPLVFSTSFDGPTTATGSATLTFRLANPRSNSVSGLRFSYDLDSILSGLVATSLPESPCGEESALTGTSLLTFSGGELAANSATNSFDVEVLVPATATAGTFPGSSSTLTSDGIMVAAAATVDLVIEPPPSFSKAFSPNSITYGETSTLTFTIDNTASALAATGLDFTDNLPAGLVVATPANASSTLTGGALTAVSGSGTISYSGGTVAAGAGGTIQVDVAPSTAGTFNNTSGALTSSSGSSGTATNTLTVVKADQTISFPNIGNQLATNVVTLSATASSGLTITNFAVVSGPAVVDGNSVSFTTSGSVTLSATQDGTGGWNAASTNISFDVTKVSAAVVLSSTNQTYDGTVRAVEVTTVPAGLAINLTYDGSAIAPTNAGSYAIAALVNEALYQGGATGTLTVAKADQTIDFPNIGNQIATNVVTLSATAASELEVSFSVASGPASISDGTNLTFTTPGSVSITASQVGDSNWNAAPSTNISFAVLPVVVYVDASRSDDSGDGLSWLTAKKTIQAAVDLLGDSGTVWVTNGVYDANGMVAPGLASSNRVCITNAVTVQSVNGPENTFIVGASDDGGFGSNSVRCAYLTDDAVLSGFTLTNGYSGAYEGGPSYNNGSGGGAYLEEGSLLTNCVLIGNFAKFGGGGAYLRSGVLVDCILIENQASYGGGAYLTYSRAYAPYGALNSCVVRENRSSNGGGVYLFAGILNNCTVVENYSGSKGGGAYVEEFGSLNNCTVVANTARGMGVFGTGGGVFLYEGGNINNSIVWNNMDETSGSVNDIVRDGLGSIRYTCALVSLKPGGGSDLQHGVNGCITNNPLLAANLRLTQDSPCINAGTNSYAPVGFDLGGNPRVVDTTVDMGAYEKQLFISQSGPLPVTMSEDNSPTAWAAPTLDATHENTNAVLTWAVATAASNGTATVSGEGLSPTVFTYAPSTNYNGSDSFAVQVTDGAETNTIAVNVTIEPVVDPADVALHDLAQTYNGTARVATATTVPTNLTVNFTYNGSIAAPTNVGSYTVIGTVDDPVYTGSATSTLTVAKADQTIEFPNIGNKLTTDTVGLSATASSGLGVVFAVASGPASIGDGTNLTFTGAGSVSITAAQSGDNNWNAAATVTNSFTVTKALGGMLLTGLSHTYDSTPKTASIITDPVGLTIDILYDGNTTAPSNAGSYQVSATINDIMYQGSITGLLTIAKADQTIDFPNIGNQIATNVVTLSATASSSLQVYFSTVSGPAIVNTNGVVSFTNSGPVVLKASQPGTGNWNSASTNISFDVTKALASVTLDNTNQTYDGTAQSVSATTVPSGLSVNIIYAGLDSAPTNAGSYTVGGIVDEALYQGSVTGTLTIAKADQVISFPNIGNQITTNVVTLSATSDFAPVAPSSVGILKVGPTVTLSVTNFGVVSGPAVIDGSQVSFTNSGTVVLSASQEGDSNWNPAPTTNITFDVTKAIASVNLSNTNQTYDGSEKTVTVSTVPRGQTVDVTYNGSSTAPVNAGSYAVIGIVNEAMYQGGATGTLTVAKADQTISFPNLGTQGVTNIVGLAASATSGFDVSLSVISGPASISNGTNLSFTAAGSVSLLATQSGDSNWNAAPSVTNSFDVIGVITNVTPDDGTVFGGTEVVIAGLWLGNGSDITNVTLCGVAATIVSQGVYSVTVSSGVAPPEGTNGNVVVESGFGSVVLTNGYTYRSVPLAPTALSAVDITDSQFTARWSNNDDTTTHYFVDVAESTNFTTMIGIYSNWNAGANTAGLVTGLVDGVTYWYRVRAANQYGSGLDSNIIEVPVSTNTPYVKQEITNGVASAGSSDVLDLSDLFHGTGKSYQIVSNSNPILVSASIDEAAGTLTFDYTAGMSGAALITIREWMEADYSGFYVDNTIQVVVTDDQPAWSAGSVTFNLGNGLFEQTISVTNTSDYDAQSVTLTVSDITDGATLYNATGTDSDGNPEIHWVGTLAGKASMDFTLQYYTAATGVTPTGTVSVSLSLERPDVELDEANEITLIGTVQSGSTFVIAFNAEIGATYYVQYADTPEGPWKTAYPPIVALTAQVQWVDSGPPVTEEAGSSRVYRVIKAD